MNQRNSLVTCVLSICAAACSQRSAAPEPVAIGAAAIVATSDAGSVGYAGYIHTLAVSKFSPGAGASTVIEFGMVKVVGADGVFASRGSGMVTALANADAPQRAGIPISDNQTHNNQVKAYFLGAGLPADQIDSVQDFEVAGSAQNDGGTLHGHPLYRYSMIRRQLGGVPVPDSFAWARMNVDGAVVEEQVFWPPIDSSVVARAVAFQASVAAVSDRAAYEARLPAHRSGATGVVIRHSPGVWDGNFYQTASFDTTDVGEFPAIHHWDELQGSVAFPFEAPNAWGPLPALPSKSPAR